MITFQGDLTKRDPDNTHKLELEASKRYVIELEGSGSNGLDDPFLIILGEGGEYIEDDNSGNDGAALIEFRPTKTQYYDITALGAGDSIGSYTLTVKVDDYRDTFDGAARVGNLDTDGVTKKGYIHEAGDVDLFETRLVKGLNYNLRLDPGPKGSNYVGDPKLSLLSQSGRTIESDDNSGNGDAAFIDYTATRNGLHFLRAEATGDDTGTYRILASIGRASYQADEIRGTKASDSISALSGNDEVSARDGNDRIWGANGDDTLKGGPGNDMIRGGEGADLISGGAGNDTLRGENGNDLVVGGADRDQIYGGEGDDTLEGGAGSDQLEGNEGADLIRGEDDYDYIRGGDGDDTLKGGDGGDSVYGDDGNDLIHGGGDSDYLRGDEGSDTLKGGNSNDDLTGGDDDDELHGGKGSDSLYGDQGADTLDGGSGSDHYNGGGGNDIFVFSDVEHSTPKNADSIYKFDKPGDKAGDLIDLSAIDGDSTTSGKQDLVFDAGASGEIGTVWLENSTKKNDSSIYIYANTDGGDEAELVVRLYNYTGDDASDYTAEDFIL